MAIKWRWDQGRLDYFLFDNIRLIAKGLQSAEGAAISSGPDPLRPLLPNVTGLAFPPANDPKYRIWRNFHRIFQLEMLASEVDGSLVTTELCYAVARGLPPAQTADDYLSHLIRNSYFPSPALQEYQQGGPRVFPFCAILKLLASRVLAGGNAEVTPTDVFQRLIGNEVSGSESVSDYATLARTSRVPQGDEGRQVRELMRVLSQLSFLKWENSRLVLDASVDQIEFVAGIGALAKPILRRRLADPDAEVLEQGRTGEDHPIGVSGILFAESDEERAFEEGSRVARYHLRAERSPTLRREFFRQGPFSLCDCCELEPPRMYPWVGNMLELHHLLPLASAVKVGVTRTSLQDLVPVCPNCHRATHSYYRQWLTTRRRADFASKAEARTVYDEAKESISVGG